MHQQTSDAYSDAGTHSYVYVQLVGKDGVTKTEWMHLDLLFTDNFQVGSVDTFVVQMRDVGLPIILNISECTTQCCLLCCIFFVDENC